MTGRNEPMCTNQCVIALEIQKKKVQRCKHDKTRNTEKSKEPPPTLEKKKQLHYIKHSKHYIFLGILKILYLSLRLIKALN